MQKFNPTTKHMVNKSHYKPHKPKYDNPQNRNARTKNRNVRTNLPLYPNLNQEHPNKPTAPSGHIEPPSGRFTQKTGK
jgi:hypothetical protein